MRSAPTSAALLALLLTAVPPAAATARQAPPEEPPEPVAAPGEGAGSEETGPGEAVEGAEEPDPAGAQTPGEVEAHRAGPIEFDLKLEEGQGTVTGRAGSLEYRREDFAVLAGGVELEYRDVTLRAERAEIDLETRGVTARGDVVFDQGPRRMTGETLTFDLGTKTGTLTEATAYVDPDYYFSGREISKVGDDVYLVVDGVFTSCDQEVPDWSFALERARVEVEAYARVRHASMKVKRLPVFYTPYLVWPTKRERSAGLLVPNFGYTDRRGAYLGLAYFQPLGRSYDTTVYLDGYGEGFVGVGDELRYRPTEGTSGRFEGYVIEDEERGETRWRAELEHESVDLPWGVRGVIDWTEYSDFDFFRDFERDFDRNSRRFEESRAFLSGNWGAHLVNLQVTDRETFTTRRINNDRQLPALEYRLRSTPIWTTPLWETPLYLTVDSSASYLSADRSETYDAEYGRFDLFPQVSFPVEPAPWLSLSLNAGYRATWYGDSLETDRAVVRETGDSFSGSSLTRTIPTFGAQVIGPSFSRIFETAVGPFSRFKHVIEPRVVYTFVDEFDDAAEVPRFDSVDSAFSGNTVRVSLINRLKAKPADEEAAGGAREVLSFELSQLFSLSSDEFLERGPARLGDPDAPFLESTSGPIDATLRFSPSDTTLLRADWRYSTLFDRLTESSISGSTRLGRHDFGLRLTTRFRPQDGDTTRNQVRFSAGVVPLPGRLALRAAIDYDIEASQLQEQRYFVDWTSQCYGIRFELRDFEVGQIRDTDYRIAFSLKNVGTFLDLTGGVD